MILRRSLPCIHFRGIDGATIVGELPSRTTDEYSSTVVVRLALVEVVVLYYHWGELNLGRLDWIDAPI